MSGTLASASRSDRGGTPEAPPPAPGWWVVVPLKGLRTAKSRLAPAGDTARRALAEAMARDTLAACLAAVGTGRVVVVTDDERIGALARTLGARCADDPGRGLNDAVRHGVSAARALATEDGEAGPWVAAVVGDLPCLDAADLAQVLRRAQAHERAFVTDADGDGTVLLTTAPGAAVRPRFGAGSARRHRVTAVELTAPVRLRLDVDDLEAWRRARDQGAGPATRVAGRLLGGA